MIKSLIRRIILAVPLLILVSITTFVFETLMPGNTAVALLGENATPQEYAAVQTTLHLNQPLLIQYWDYVKGLFHGSLGVSIFTGESVAHAIYQRFPVTLSVIFGALILSTIVGVWLGIQSAVRGRLWAKIVDVFSLLGLAMPSFWIALMLVALFAVRFSWFPATGYEPFSGGVVQWLHFLVLPIVALSAFGIATISKVTRDAMLSTLQMDFIRTLRAAGIPRRSIIWKHGLRNSSVPIVTMVGLTAIHSITGAILIESVFALPGIGLLVVDATNKHDIPIVQGVALVLTLFVIVMNLLVDLSYGLLDPRTRVQ